MSDFPTELFWELASELRCSILSELQRQNLKPTQLAKKIGQTIQETHRQCDRLERVHLIKRQAKGELALTPIGKMTLEQFSYFRFITKNRKYFDDHTTGSLPPQFMQRLGALEGCELLEGTFAIMERWKKISKEAKKYLKFVSVQVSLDVFRLGVLSAKRGTTVSLVHGKNTIYPKGSKAELTDSMVQGLIEKQAYQRKMVESIDVVVVFNEKQGTVVFPDTHGKTDVNYAFSGIDLEFLDWCNDYFDHMWEKASRWDISKMREI
jgi:predicted transcriptional regulator